MLLFIFYISILCQLISQVSYVQCGESNKKSTSLTHSINGGCDPSWTVCTYIQDDEANSQWEITVTDDKRYFAMFVDIAVGFCPGSWGFHSSAPSTIRFKLYASTTPAQSSPDNDLALVFSFSDGNQPTSKYFSSLIQISNNYDTDQFFFNAIGPSCDEVDNPTALLHVGQVQNTVDGFSSPDDRWKRAGLTGNTRRDAESWLPEINGVTEWPITFTIKNYPYENKVVAEFSANGTANTPTPAPATYTYTQSCGFKDTFAGGKGVFAYFSADKAGQQITINQIDVEYWYHCIANPTLATSQPTNNPTSDPTKDPTFIPTFQPTSDPTRDPTKDPTFVPTNKGVRQTLQRLRDCIMDVNDEIINYHKNPNKIMINNNILKSFDLFKLNDQYVHTTDYIATPTPAPTCNHTNAPSTTSFAILL